MKKKLSPWCKQVKIELIKKDWSIGDLAKVANMTREYTSSIINGRAYSAQATKIISDILNIPDISESED